MDILTWNSCFEEGHSLKIGPRLIAMVDRISSDDGSEHSKKKVY